MKGSASRSAKGIVIDNIWPSGLSVCWFLVASALIQSACTSVFLQDDGFRSKLARGCNSRRDCEELQREAEKRIDGCRANTVGYVRCDEASSDLRQAESLVAVALEKEATQQERTEVGTAATPATASAQVSHAEPTSASPEPNELEQDREAVQRGVREGTDVELKTGRCTAANVGTLQRALGFAKQSASADFIFTDHRTIVATDAEMKVDLTAGPPGEYHVFAVLPGVRRKFELKVFDADGYKVEEQSHYTGLFSMYGTTSSGGSVVQWPSTVAPIRITARGEGCAMLVVAYRVGS